MQTGKLTYRYTALDLLTDVIQGQQLTQRFYYQGLLVTELHGADHRAVLLQGGALLAQQCSVAGIDSNLLLGTDLRRSVLQVVSAEGRRSALYTPWGYRRLGGLGESIFGFAGEPPDVMTGHYLLGSYRAFNPCLMRFNSPDSWSPFGQGGLNAYAYCVGDPVNRSDPTGHAFWSKILRLLGVAKPAKKTMRSVAELVKSQDVINDISGKLMRSNRAPAGDDWIKMEQARNHGTDAVSFSTKQGAEANLMAHGNVGAAIVDKAALNADRVLGLLSKNIGPETKQINLYLCHSAAVNEVHQQSLAQVVANKSGLPTLGVHGRYGNKTFPYSYETASHFGPSADPRIDKFRFETFYPEPRPIRQA